MRRFQLSGLAAIVLFASLTVACGGESDGSSSRETGAATRCQDETLELLDGMRALALKILHIDGIYVGYRDEVEKLREARTAARLSSVSTECSRRVVTPANRAFTAYVTAYERWQQCTSRPGGCAEAAIEAELDRHWRRADDLRMEAEQNLDALLQAEYAARPTEPPG